MTARHILLIIFSVIAFVALVVFGAAHSTSTLMNRIHNEGRSARQLGWPIETNPYIGVNSVYSEAWIRGYMKATQRDGVWTVTLIGGFNDGVRVMVRKDCESAKPVTDTGERETYFPDDVLPVMIHESLTREQAIEMLINKYPRPF